MPLTLDQIARRRGGIGGSDIGSLVGVNPWASPIDVWRDKTQPQQPHAATPATQRGDFLEPALREWYAFLFDRQVQLCDTMQHREHDIVMATPDGISEHVDGGDPVLIEIKSPGPRTQRDWGEDGSDLIPLYYLPQVVWTLAVTQLNHAHVVALVYGELRVYQVPFEQELFDELLAKAQQFWTNHVKPRVPPPVDGSSGYADYLARKFRRVQADAEVVTGQRAEYWAHRLESAKRAQARAADNADYARNQLKAMMGEASRLESRLGHVTWNPVADKRHVDWKGVAAELGIPQDVIDRHTRVKPGGRQFRDYLHRGADASAVAENDDADQAAAVDDSPPDSPKDTP